MILIIPKYHMSVGLILEATTLIQWTMTIDGHTTEGGMWSTNNSGSNGYSGGWIKYPEMPHRMVIKPRYNNSRLPDYLKTGFIPPNGTDYTTWTTRYEFNDPSNPSSYNIPLGGGWDYSCCMKLKQGYDSCPVLEKFFLEWRIVNLL